MGLPMNLQKKPTSQEVGFEIFRLIKFLRKYYFEKV